MVVSTSTLQSQSRAELRRAFESPEIIVRLRNSNGGRIAPIRENWGSYWLPVARLGNSQVDDALSRLGRAWRDYIASSFDMSLAREYCRAYFLLLNVVLSSRDGSHAPPAWQAALRAVLGFESFIFEESIFGLGGCAAGTTNLRNPCYLIAKLKSPEAPDNTRLHPLIYAGAGSAGDVFHHYRRYRLQEDSPMSLLVYPALDVHRRSKSLEAVAGVARGLGSKGDPFSHARAERLGDHAVHPNTGGLGRRLRESRLG